MPNEAYYSNILKQYPETISKEQLYKLCHISKRVAKYYLDMLGVILACYREFENRVDALSKPGEDGKR